LAQDLDLSAKLTEEIGLKGPKELTPMQKWAANFAWAVFGSVVLLSLGLYVRFCLAPGPSLPNLQSMSAEDATRAIAQYKELRELNGRDFSDHFDLLIGKGLLPILTTLVGYMLGRKK
jgi:hypothetical protein